VNRAAPGNGWMVSARGQASTVQSTVDEFTDPRPVPDGTTSANAQQSLRADIAPRSALQIASSPAACRAGQIYTASVVLRLTVTGACLQLELTGTGIARAISTTTTWQRYSVSGVVPIVIEGVRLRLTIRSNSSATVYADLQAGLFSSVESLIIVFCDYYSETSCADQSLIMARKGNILVVDDEEIMRDVLESLLAQEGHRVELAKTGEEGLQRLSERAFDVILLDVSMPGMGGLRTLEEILKLDAEAVVIMITAYATFDTAIAAWQLGAFSCIRKPFENAAILRTVIAGLARRRGDEERRLLRRTLKASADRNQVIGTSEAMREVFDLVEQVAPARSTVLITGESGTGKEVIARTIHFSSPRAESGQFVAVNCSNIPTELLESELFGHTKGAFTGAITAKKGLFEAADSGTIFLDEISTIPPETQARLLRVIQEREFTPLGDTQPRRVDVRIIAATNIDLRKAVEVGDFREDLFYRLNVINIHLPPLRDRRADILPLAQHFIRKYNAENGRTLSDQLSPELLGVLEAHRWPGNVRELETAIERAVIIARGSELTIDCLREEIITPGRLPDLSAGENEGFTSSIDLTRGISFYDEVSRFEVELIRRALELTGGHQSRAARLLGMNNTTLNSKIKAYNIRP
jgi:DNA-binding NtrC family response regulator